MYIIKEEVLMSFISSVLWVIENDSYIPPEKMDELIQNYNQIMDIINAD